jgi:hypothetical protein
MAKRVVVEPDQSGTGCKCEEIYKVVVYEGQRIVQVLGSGIKSYEVADNIRRVAEGR